MKDVEQFNIQIQEKIKDDFYLPPEDELNEFSAFEMGLKRFCFEHNRRILIELGDEKIQLHLYHDILDALEEGWSMKMSKLSAGSKVIIDFNDFILRITPTLDENLAACEFTTFGTGKHNYCTLSLSQLSDKMRIFTDEILGMAVREGYINSEDIAEYLGWQLNRV